MTVDEILASGRYRDRRGRMWIRCTAASCELGDGWFTWWRPTRNHDMIHPTKSEMRLLIERDMHRDECEGLGQCWNHPVAHVVIDHQLGLFDAFNPGSDVWGGDYDSLPEAMDAARALAVEE